MSEEKLAKAFRLLLEDKPKKALKICNKVLAKTPNDDYTLALKGDCLNALEQYNEALSYYNKALAISPELLNVWMRKAELLIDLNKLDEAYKCVEFVLDQDQEFPMGWFVKGRCLDLMGKSEDGLKCLNIGLHLDSNAFPGWVVKGFILSNLDRCEEAIECFDIALSINPDSIEALSSLALLYCYDDNKKALEYCDKTFKLDSTNNLAFLVKSHILANAGKIDEALNIVNKALKYYPDDEEFIYLKNELNR